MPSEHPHPHTRACMSVRACVAGVVAMCTCMSACMPYSIDTAAPNAAANISSASKLIYDDPFAPEMNRSRRGPTCHKSSVTS
jgi:hypothetical protein